ncbi:tyrosine-type recombinase/integrase [Aeromonas veronii]|uniref:tyrosine-type recombinase/integrase n=1 Tax=Aeromonas veronii TaxID=654 RepID=UPI00236473EB|nr:tyrosine-type recombinase/integrase [Aeromonas veronii]MDD1845577.1 tyrosine-type recombinase/integrase [Aeromonas veronii]
MASFDTLKSGTIRVRILVKNGSKSERLQKTFPSMEEARVWADKVESRNAVVCNVPESVTVDDLHKAHLLRAVGPSTIEREEGHYKHLKPTFGKSIPERLTQSDVDKYIEKALKTRHWNTIRREVIYLKSLLKRVESNPLANLKVKGESTSVKRPITASDYKALLEATREKNRWIIRLLMESGWRRAEIWSLRPCDVRLEDNIADFPDAKTHDERMRTFTDDCRLLLEQVIKEHLESGRKDTERLCRFSRPNGISVMFIRSREKAGLGDHVHPHNFRHGFITRAQNFFGLTVSDVMMFTGHRDKKTVMRYTQPMVEVARAKMKGVRRTEVGQVKEENWD